MANESGSAVAVGCIAMVITVVVGTIWRGFVLVFLWSWFVVPLGMDEIGKAHAIGLSMMFSMLLAHSSGDTKTDPDAEMSDMVLKLILHVFGGPAVVLLLGWIVHSFM